LALLSLDLNQFLHLTRRVDVRVLNLILFSDYCESGIDLDESRIVACDYGLQQRKAREGIESLREKIDQKVVLNNLEQLTAWRPTLDKRLDIKSRAHACR